MLESGDSVVIFMSTIKDEVIELIKQMPDDVSIIDIMAELYFCQKVNQGLKELDAGSGISHEKVKGKIRGFL